MPKNLLALMRSARADLALRKGRLKSLLSQLKGRHPFSVKAQSYRDAGLLLKLRELYQKQGKPPKGLPRPLVAARPSLPSQRLPLPAAVKPQVTN